MEITIEDFDKGMSIGDTVKSKLFSGISSPSYP